MSARLLLRVDALGCAVAAVVAAARGSVSMTLLLAASAALIGFLSARPDGEMALNARVVAAANVLWSIVVAAALALGWIDGTDAVLVGLTIPYSLALAALQLQAARTKASAQPART